MTESWRVKIASSLAFTLPPNWGILNSLPFSVILVAVICCRFSRLANSVLFEAVIVPLTLPPERLGPRYLLSRLFLPPLFFQFFGRCVVHQCFFFLPFVVSGS